MIAAKAKRNEQKRESVLEAIRQMVEEMDPALKNYSEIARRAGVHRNYVAGRFAAEIELAQTEVNRRYATGTAYRHSMSVASLRAERTMFKEQAQAQAKELARLRKRLGISSAGRSQPSTSVSTRRRNWSLCMTRTSVSRRASRIWRYSCAMRRKISRRPVGPTPSYCGN